jgi:hypothetical protein
MNLNEALLSDIKLLATETGQQFLDPRSNWLGRPVFTSGQSMPHTLAILSQSGELAKCGYTLPELRGYLKVIKASCKLFCLEAADSQEKSILKALIEQVKQAQTLLTPIDEKHFVTAPTFYSNEVIDLVGANASIFQALKDTMSIQGGSLSFRSQVNPLLDDKMLEELFKQQSEAFKKVTHFEFADFPLLSARAPALILKACPNISPSCLESITDIDRFLDHTLIFPNNGQEIAIRVNKGMLAHYSGYFAKTFTNLVETKQDPTTTKVELKGQEKALFFIHALLGIEDILDLKNAVALFKTANYLDCPTVLQESFSAILNELKTHPLTFNYKDLAELDLHLESRKSIVNPQLLYDYVTTALIQRANRSVESLGLDVVEPQQTMLLSHFITQELSKMAKIPSFPFPPDLRLRLNVQAAEAHLFPKNFYKLVQTIRQLTPEEDRAEHQEISALIEKPSKTALEKKQNDNFMQKIKQKTDDLGSGFTRLQTLGLQVYFAHTEIKKLLASGKSLPHDLVTTLSLAEYVDTLEKSNPNPSKFPKALTLLLIQLQAQSTTDAKIPYLLGKIGSKSSRNQDVLLLPGAEL